MFRWLKGSKNKGKDRKSPDNYGFPGQSTTTNYGFRATDSLDNSDSSVHIYDEISELPEISFSRQFTLLPDETNIGNVEGPYLVVPILPARRTTENGTERSENCSDMSFSSSVSKGTIYHEPWDKSANKGTKTKKSTIAHPAFRDSDSGYTCSSVSTKTDSERTSDSDTGCEYDMSISTGSDVSCEYKDLISKMQNNLALKHQVLKMIKESEKDPDDHNHSETSNKTSVTSLDSCEFIRSRDVFENDDAESEYSSGFDDCEMNGNTPSVISGNSEYSKSASDISSKSRNSDILLKNLQRQYSSSSNKSFEPTSCSSETNNDRILQASESVQNLRSMKSKSSHTSHIGRVPKNSCNDNAISKRNSLTGLISKPTKIYSSNTRVKQPSSNRLLGDLINMNHNMQTLKF